MKSILIIDDNKVNLATARMVLRDEYKIIPVTSGAQALIYLEKNDCDIILLDINMPEMDGFETLKKIRAMQHCQNIPVIFLTADSDAETETRCFHEGNAFTNRQSAGTRGTSPQPGRQTGAKDT